MTKPSRIVKSTWKQAGKPGSLKSFARAHVHRQWLKNKAAQRTHRKRGSRRSTTSHNDVYANAKLRSHS